MSTKTNTNTDNTNNTKAKATNATNTKAKAKAAKKVWQRSTVVALKKATDSKLLLSKQNKAGDQSLNTIPKGKWCKANKSSWRKDYPGAESINQAYAWYYQAACEELKKATDALPASSFIRRISVTPTGSFTIGGAESRFSRYHH